MVSITRGVRYVRAFVFAVVVLLGAAPALAVADGCQFVGEVDFAYAGTSAVLTADQVLNLDTATSANLRIELWALTAPYTGAGASGYKVAQFAIGQISSGASLYKVSSGTIAFTPPPTGTWTFVLFVTEFNGGAADDGYVPTDWRNFAQPVVYDPSATPTALAIEYYYAAWNYYFVTAFPDEIAALDGGAFGGAWQRTGRAFAVWTQSDGVDLPTCRFFSAIFAPKSSHFYTPYADECASLKAGQGWQYEGIAFYLQLPDANGLCPSGTVVLYRLYNNGMGGAPNHSYTISVTTLNQLIAAGWTFEGNGNTRAFACVPL
jgi:hypothetical protein